MKALKLFLVVLLTGCSLQWSQPSTEIPPIEDRALCDSKLQYCIHPPEAFVDRGWTDNWVGLGGAATAHTASNGLAPDDPHYIRLDFYHSSPSIHCSPSLTGASEMMPLTSANAETVWGRVDLQDLMKLEGYMPPYDVSNVKCGGAEHVYALCSEKDGKTVLICISQITDNPALAEEIFSTFQWTE